MAKVWCLIREQPHYRRDAFVAGLEAAGWPVECRNPGTFGPDDMVVIWNRYGRFATAAEACEGAGGKALIVENGYMGRDQKDLQFYAIAEGGHMGSGRWHVGGPERWEALGFELAPWRKDGGHVLVCAQRGIGSPLMASPPGWHDKAAAELATYTSREIRVRLHPKDKRNPSPAGGPSLADDLAGAWVCVVWSSASAIQALVAGIPAIHAAPHHVAALAMGNRLAQVEDPPMGDRVPGLVAMAWAQWSVDEIGAGAPFRHNGWTPPES